MLHIHATFIILDWKKIVKYKIFGNNCRSCTKKGQKPENRDQKPEARDGRFDADGSLPFNPSTPQSLHPLSPLPLLLLFPHKPAMIWNRR
jgi:hypothetical protein